MKLSGYREAAEFYSAKASDIIRHLSFAGIGVVWIFSSTNTAGIALPIFLLCPLLIFVLSLIADLLQYVIGYTTWDSFHRRQEQIGLGENDTVLDYNSLGKKITLFFWIKLALVLSGHSILGIYIVSEIIS